jgi:hypothetical protein
VAKSTIDTIAKQKPIICFTVRVLPRKKYAAITTMAGYIAVTTETREIGPFEAAYR